MTTEATRECDHGRDDWYYDGGGHLRCRGCDRDRKRTWREDPNNRAREATQRRERRTARAGRLLSYTEISTALTCMARWDFRYGDQLAGSSLKQKDVPPLLSGGRAWGAAVAAWHSNVGDSNSGRLAIEALDASLAEDAERQKQFGVHRQDHHDELRRHLLTMLLHYFDTVDPWELDPVVEKELLVPLPSRSGIRPSSRYKLLCYLDGTSTDDDAAPWGEEFKLRGNLTSVELITNSRQIRWYAWAYWRQTGVKLRGVWVNERLNAEPKPARTVIKSKAKGTRRPSHAKDQMCTADAYIDLCKEYDEEPQDEVVHSLKARRWHQRVPVMFRDGELEEAGHELVSAAKLIHQLDNGDLLPLRNVSPRTCGGCAFRDVCPSPDSSLVEELFERVPAKRDRDHDERSSDDAEPSAEVAAGQAD